MTHEEKVDLYLARFARDQPGRALPWWPWKSLSRVGIKLAPPEFLNPVVNFFLFTLYIALLWSFGGLLSILLGRSSWTLFADMVRTGFIWFLLFLSILTAVILAAIMDVWARRHRYGSWSKFGE